MWGQWHWRGALNSNNVGVKEMLWQNAMNVKPRTHGFYYVNMIACVLTLTVLYSFCVNDYTLNLLLSAQICRCGKRYWMGTLRMRQMTSADVCKVCLSMNIYTSTQSPRKHRVVCIVRMNTVCSSINSRSSTINYDFIPFNSNQHQHKMRLAPRAFPWGRISLNSQKAMCQATRHVNPGDVC